MTAIEQLSEHVMDAALDAAHAIEVGGVPKNIAIPAAMHLHNVCWLPVDVFTVIVEDMRTPVREEIGQ